MPLLPASKVDELETLEHTLKRAGTPITLNSYPAYIISYIGLEHPIVCTRLIDRNLNHCTTWEDMEKKLHGTTPEERNFTK